MYYKRTRVSGREVPTANYETAGEFSLCMTLNASECQCSVVSECRAASLHVYFASNRYYMYL